MQKRGSHPRSGEPLGDLTGAGLETPRVEQGEQLVHQDGRMEPGRDHQLVEEAASTFHLGQLGGGLPADGQLTDTKVTHLDLKHHHQMGFEPTLLLPRGKDTHLVG